MLKELPDCPPVSLADESGHSEFALPVDANEQMQLAFSGLHLAYADVEEADRAALEMGPSQLFAPLHQASARCSVAAASGAAQIAPDGGWSAAGRKDSRQMAEVYVAGMPQRCGQAEQY